jgi:hypothetical protein
MSERKSTPTEQYAHVFLFACPRCDRPLSGTCFSEQRNLEGAEGTQFSLHCHCGWKGDVAGVVAMKHWVERWPHPVRLDGEEGACKEEGLEGGN